MTRRGEGEQRISQSRVKSGMGKIDLEASKLNNSRDAADLQLSYQQQMELNLAEDSRYMQNIADSRIPSPIPLDSRKRIQDAIARFHSHDAKSQNPSED